MLVSHYTVLMTFSLIFCVFWIVSKLSCSIWTRCFIERTCLCVWRKIWENNNGFAIVLFVISKEIVQIFHCYFLYRDQSVRPRTALFIALRLMIRWMKATRCLWIKWYRYISFGRWLKVLKNRTGSISRSTALEQMKTNIHFCNNNK